MKLLRKIGKYIEIRMLVESKEEDDSSTNYPIVNIELQQCESQDLAYMYLTLKSTLDTFMKKYPAQCLLAELTMDLESINSEEIELKSDQQEE